MKRGRESFLEDRNVPDKRLPTPFPFPFSIFMRPQANYDQSLALLTRAKTLRPDVTVKSGIMVGAGERREEVDQTIRDIADRGTDILTIGQYLQPTPNHVAIDRFYDPGEFEDMKSFASSLGYTHVESGPLVRSSYHAADQAAPVTG